MSYRGQGAFEYLLLLGGTVLVATVVTVMAQTSVYDANNAFNASTSDYSTYIEGGVNDVLANGTLVHELPPGCAYNNPPCDAGYFCDGGVCRQVNVQLRGFVRDPSGVALSGVVVHLVGGAGLDVVSDASGYYEMSVAVNGSSTLFSVTASRSPTNVQGGAVVNLTAGFATVQNFTLSYAPASLSGYVRDPSGVGVNGVVVSCAGLSATSASGGAYSISGIPMTSASTTCTLAGSKAPAFVSNSTSVTLNAGVAVSQNLVLAYSPASLSGFIRNSSGTGIAGANVSCAGYSTTTSSTGAYSFSSIAMSAATSACTLAASKPPAFVSGSVLVSLAAGTTTSGQNLALSYSAAAVSGFVRDASGVGVNGAAVSCAGKTATTSSAGAYSISGIAMSSASTTCTLAASKSPAFVSGSASVALAAGTTASGQNVTLSYASSSVSGYVRDASGVGVNGAAVSCAGKSATTASGGAFTISGIPMAAATGTCTLAASKSGYTSASTTASLSAGASTSGQNLQLASAGFSANYESGSIGSWTAVMTTCGCSYLYLNPVSAGRGAYSMESHGYNTGCGSAHALAVDYFITPQAASTFKFSLKWVSAGTLNYANYILGIRGTDASGSQKWMAYRFRYGHGGGGYGTWYFDWTYWHTGMCAMVDIGSPAGDPASGTWYDFTRTLSSDFASCSFVPVSYDAIGITEGSWAGNEYWYLDDVSIR